MGDSTSTATSVYRYYDENGVLLYVGITSRGIARNSEHNTSKDWWKYVTAQEVEHYTTRRGAMARERELITSRRPPFNKQHNPDAGPLREAYLKMRAMKSSIGLSVQQALTLPNGRVELALLPIIDPASITLSYAVGDVPEDIDISDPSKIRFNSGGRKAKIRDVRWTKGSLRLAVTVRNAEACVGAYAKLRTPQGKGQRPSIKVIELIFAEAGK